MAEARRWLVAEDGGFRLIEYPRKPRRMKNGRYQRAGNLGAACRYCVRRILPEDTWLPVEDGGGPVELNP